VRLIFNSHHAKSKAEKLREQIVQAFESALGSSVIIEFRCELKNHSSVTLPASKNGLLHIRDMSSCEPQAQLSHYGSGEVGRGEVVEIDALPRVAYNQIESNHRNLEGSQGAVSVSRRNSTMSSISETREGGAQSQSQSIVRSKVSLAHVIQQAEGCSQRNGRSKHKTVSIAEELEQENLYVLLPQSFIFWQRENNSYALNVVLKLKTVFYFIEQSHNFQLSFDHNLQKNKKNENGNIQNLSNKSLLTLLSHPAKTLFIMKLNIFGLTV